MTSQGSESIGGSGGRVQLSDDDQILRITQVEVSDSGRYTCNATNNKGEEIATATLTVLREYTRCYHLAGLLSELTVQRFSVCLARCY